MPTSKLAGLGKWADALLLDSPDVIAAATELGERVAETVVLGVRNDLMAQYVYVRLAPRPLMYHNSAGVLRPLCASGVGWAILSTMRDETVRKIVRRYNAAEENALTRIDVPSLMRTVQTARARLRLFARRRLGRGRHDRCAAAAQARRAPDGDRRRRAARAPVGRPRFDRPEHSRGDDGAFGIVLGAFPERGFQGPGLEHPGLSVFLDESVLVLADEQRQRRPVVGAGGIIAE